MAKKKFGNAAYEAIYRRYIAPRKTMMRVVSVALALCLFWLYCMPTSASFIDTNNVVTYTVRPGDTLWQYASAITKRGADVNDSIELLMQLNQLTSPTLMIGQTLRVPILQN